jgi:hypothetical protein
MSEKRYEQEAEHDDEQRHDDERLTSSVLVCPGSRGQREDSEEHHAENHHENEVVVAESQAGNRGIRCGPAVAERERGHQVEQYVGREHDERAKDQFAPVGLEHRRERQLLDPVCLDDLGEDFTLYQAQPHPESDDDHNGRE